MVKNFDRSRSLQELEDDDWGKPSYHSSLVVACHRLRRKPLNEFTIADLRIMIGQSIGLLYLVPLAIEMLEEDPLVEGEFYPGDLLSAVLSVDESFWASRADYFQRTYAVALRLKNHLSALDEVRCSSLEEVFRNASPAFRSLASS